MSKIYMNKNVYDAAIERYHTIFNEFDNYYVSVSGGKDSSVMLQLMAREARNAGKKFSVLYIDLEAQYKATIEHVDELVDLTKDVVDEWYWVALPLSLRNAVSAIQPKWICWDKKDKDKWVREFPTMRNDVILCTEDSMPEEWDWFYRGMEFEEFILWFAKWYNETHGGKTAAGIGIRSDESLNRFRTIISESKERYKDFPWTTRVKCKSELLNCWNFYPLYDWRTEDDWTAVSKLDLKFNQIYELMYKNGLSIYEQRLCQPYGDDQRKGLDQFRSLEPETWEKVLSGQKSPMRLPGRNMRYFSLKVLACTRRKSAITIIPKLRPSWIGTKRMEYCQRISRMKPIKNWNRPKRRHPGDGLRERSRKMIFGCQGCLSGKQRKMCRGYLN